MTSERALALARARVPDLHHAVLGARDEAQVVGGQRPDALDVAKEGAHAGLGARGVRVGQRVGGEDDEGVGGVVRGGGLVVFGVGLGLGLVDVPEADGGVQGASEHVAGWSRAVSVVGPEGERGGGGFVVVVVADGANATSIVVFVTRVEGVMVELKLGGHELELLDLADVALENLQTLLSVEIPKSD